MKNLACCSGSEWTLIALFTAVSAVVSVLALAAPAPALAQAPCANPVAVVESAPSSVQLVQASTQVPQPAVEGQQVCAGDTIRVGDASRAVILILATGTRMAVDRNSELVVAEPTADDRRSLIDLLRGALLYLSRPGRPAEVRTPFVNASVEGTEFLVRVEVDRTIIAVYEGAVRASNTLGALLVEAGQQAVTVQGQAPQLEVPVSPDDAVQWALYYEPVLPLESLAELDQIAQTGRDARFYLRRATALLAAGSLEDARSDIDEALQLAPNDGEAYALRAVIAVAQNDRTSALDNGRRAVELSPRSSAAGIALSYALQANFALEEARAVIERTVDVQPDDGSAWARLAELRLMLDDVKGAAEAADEAVTLAPTLARPRVARGFVKLAQLRPAEAEQDFEQALQGETNNPLALLGQGLAKIRRGQLTAGTDDLSRAVLNAPTSTIMRSYLGKAYFEERDEQSAGEEFTAAQGYDRLDPTPWFYDAIRLQSVNRPVGALKSLEESIARNDNRAVYRSKFQLYDDAATRNASLGRIYRDLNFERLALVEAWKSVNVDPSNYSGHRLLADSYSALERHEIARVSELLQAQLLQPINTTALQPQLAETDLLVIQGAGPSDIGFNEFGRVFTRNGVNVQASGLVAGRDTRGDDFVVAGVLDRFSVSVGQFHYETSGARPNNDQSQDIYNVFIQTQLSPRTSVQGELRRRDAEFGDLELRFDPAAFSSTIRQREKTTSARVGIRHALAANSDLIGSVIYRRGDFDTRESFSGLPIVFNTASDGYIGEVQHLFRSEKLTLISGVGRFSASQTDEELILFPPSTTTDSDIAHTNVYVYALMDSPRNLRWTVGVSADFLDSPFRDRNQANPKVGLQWAITPHTQLRAALFRVLRRSLLSGMTIELTQVAGFNQFFDDDSSTDSWRYAIGLDHKVSSAAYVGIELSERDLDVPTRVVAGGTSNYGRTSWDESNGHAYLYLTHWSRVAVTTEFRYQHFRRPEDFVGTGLFSDLTGYFVPVGVTYFDPRGVTVGVRTTHAKQSGKFQEFTEEGDEVFVSQEAQSWITDIEISYRLPRRFGLFTLGVKNLFDQQIRLQDTDPRNPRFSPSRLATGTLTFAF